MEEKNQTTPEMTPDEAAASLALATNFQKQLLMGGKKPESEPTEETLEGEESQEQPQSEPVAVEEVVEGPDIGAQMAEMKDSVTSQIDGLKTEVQSLVKESIKSEMAGLTKIIKDALK